MTDYRTHRASREWEIDCRLRELTKLLVRNIICDDERAEMLALQRERVERMMPKFPKAQ